MYVALENLHSDVVISTPRKTLSYSSKMLRHLSEITFLPEGTYVIVIEEEIHMGKGERVMKTWNEYSKEARFFSVRFHNKNIFINFRIMKTTMFLFIFLMMCIIHSSVIIQAHK